MTPPAEWNVMDLLFPVVVSPLEGLRQEAAELFAIDRRECRGYAEGLDCCPVPEHQQDNDCPCKRVVCTYPKCEAGSVLD